MREAPWKRACNIETGLMRGPRAKAFPEFLKFGIFWVWEHDNWRDCLLTTCHYCVKIFVQRLCCRAMRLPDADPIMHVQRIYRFCFRIPSFIHSFFFMLSSFFPSPSDIHTHTKDWKGGPGNLITSHSSHLYHISMQGTCIAPCCVTPTQPEPAA